MARRKRLTAYRVDEIATAEAVVAFYEQRLEQALEKLGALLDEEENKKTPRLRSGTGS